MPLLSILGGNLLVMLSALAFHAGASLVYRRPLIWQWYCWIALVFLAGYYYFWAFQDNLNARIAVISVLRIPIFAHAAYVIHVGRRARASWGGLLLQGTAIVWAILLIDRSIISLAFDSPIHSFVGASGFQAIYFIATGLSNVLIAVALARMEVESLERGMALSASDLADTNAVLVAEIEAHKETEIALCEREALIRKSESQIKSILDASPVGIFFIDGDSRIVRANTCFTEMLAIPPNMMIGSQYTDFLAPASRNSAGRAISDAFKQKIDAISVEREFFRRDGSIFWGDLTGRPVTNDAGDVIGLVGVVVDAADRIKLRDAVEAERQAMGEQRNFLAMVSHEFRVPLSIISAASQLQLMDFSLSEVSRDEAGKIERAVRRMTDMIDVYLADDRLHAPQLSLNVANVNLGDMVDRIVKDKRMDSRRGDNIMVWEDNPVTISVDPALLFLALSNLLANALKFSTPSSPIEIGIVSDGETAMISITDHGQGIDNEDLPRVFEKFFRSSGSKTIPGAGLGLYIVKRIVELHNGSVCFDSVPGEGTTFLVWLPLRMEGVS